MFCLNRPLYKNHSAESFKMKLSEDQKNNVASIVHAVCRRGIWKTRPSQDREDAEQHVIATLLRRMKDDKLEVANLDAYVRTSAELELRSCLKKFDRDRQRTESKSIWLLESESDSIKFHRRRWESDWSDEERSTLQSAISLLPPPLRSTVNRFLEGQGRGKGRDHYKFSRALTALRNIVERNDF